MSWSLVILIIILVLSRVQQTTFIKKKIVSSLKLLFKCMKCIRLQPHIMPLIETNAWLMNLSIKHLEVVKSICLIPIESESVWSVKLLENIFYPKKKKKNIQEINFYFFINRNWQISVHFIHSYKINCRINIEHSSAVLQNNEQTFNIEHCINWIRNIAYSGNLGNR